MVRIRLMRVGKRKQPAFRVVVADARSPRDGRIIEAIGHYQPRTEPSEIEIDSERAVYWLNQGAQPSNTVRKLLEISGAWSSFTGEAPTMPTPAADVVPTPAASVEDDEPAESDESSESGDSSSDEEEADA